MAVQLRVAALVILGCHLSMNVLHGNDGGAERVPTWCVLVRSCMHGYIARLDMPCCGRIGVLLKATWAWLVTLPTRFDLDLRICHSMVTTFKQQWHAGACGVGL